MSEVARSAFGDFLRSRRERLHPEAVGLPVGRGRRTAGLRRQEVAERAGIGIDWYIRLEQGRAVSPSAATLAALARALCLEPAEAAHLQALAGQVFARFGAAGPVTYSRDVAEAVWRAAICRSSGQAN